MDLAKLDEPFTVVSYDTTWPVRFEQERDRLASVLGVLVVSETT